jgi:hypothetical protein
MEHHPSKVLPPDKPTIYIHPEQPAPHLDILPQKSLNPGQAKPAVKVVKRR